MLKRISLAICICFYLNTSFADMQFVHHPDVQDFINKMVVRYHFKKSELVTWLNAVKIRPRILTQISKPAEMNPWDQYQQLFITQSRIHQGVKFWNKYNTTLREAEKIYGVPADIIVATIGVETKFGNNLGSHRVIDALAMLGFSNSSRAGFFRHELQEYLLLCREQHFDPLKIRGSYAGAIGMPQFMPSSYRAYAVAFAGKRADLIHNEKDVIFSIANYYHQHGWQPHQLVVIPATLQAQEPTQMDSRMMLSTATLKKYGIHNNKNPTQPMMATLVKLTSAKSNEYWIGLHNFDVIKRYNSSDLYAMAVYELGYYMAITRNRLPHTT